MYNPKSLQTRKQSHVKLSKWFSWGWSAGSFSKLYQPVRQRFGSQQQGTHLFVLYVEEEDSPLRRRSLGLNLLLQQALILIRCDFVSVAGFVLQYLSALTVSVYSCFEKIVVVNTACRVLRVQFRMGWVRIWWIGSHSNCSYSKCNRGLIFNVISAGVIELQLSWRFGQQLYLRA